MRSCLILLSVCQMLVGCTATPPTSTSDPPTRLVLENLLQQTLAEDFTPGREVIVSLVEIPPNTTMERHWHPGEEFHYYLEGRAEIEIDGQPAFTGVPGATGHIPYRAMHTATTGPEGAKAIVFRVHTTGEPVRYLEKGGEADR